MDRTPLSADIEDLTARLAEVTDNLPAAITEIDRDHRVVFANQTALAWIQLESIDDVLGRNVVDVVGNEAWEHQRPYVEAALSGQVVTGQNDIVLPGGEQRVLEFTHVPRFDAAGTVIGYCTLSVDVTARKELEADLARTQRVEAIGQMTAGIAHDFNNLLSIILGNLELLAEQIDDPAQRDLIRPAIDATHKGADLTKNLLNFAMRAPLRPSALNLNDIVRDLEAWTSRTIPANVRVTTSLQPDIPPVLADLAATEAALLNLMNNARDAMPHGGELTVSTWSESPHGDSRTIVVVAVSDTGVGIPDDLIADVFDPFVTTKGLGLGSGLGLSMVRGFMQQSGGDVELRSEAGVGTTVELIFAAADGPIAGTSDVARESVRRPPTPARILVVDDQEAVLSALIRLLERAGHEVVGATNGDLALDVIGREGPFELLITDMVMPGALQGSDLAQRAREAHATLPVIFLSGYADEVARRDYEIPAGDIRLIKPVPASDLIDAVQSALADAADRL